MVFFLLLNIGISTPDKRTDVSLLAKNAEIPPNLQGKYIFSDFSGKCCRKTGISAFSREESANEELQLFSGTPAAVPVDFFRYNVYINHISRRA